MNERRWSEVDSYFAKTLIGSDAALEATLAANSAAGLPSIDVSAPQGKLIHLLARMSGARKALEIGTLGGYSTIWLARALPDDGRLITLEVSARHADVARRNVARAGLERKVEIRTGAALETLPRIEAEGLGPFDFVFIDADKTNNAAYLEWALRLSQAGNRDHGRQCGAGGRGDRRGEPQPGRRRRAPHVRPDRRASPGSAQPRSRPSARRVGTDLRWRLCSDRNDG